MRASFVLTVAESKRLIAKGVANLAVVKKALEKGMVAIAKGTTNSYVVEEILGEKIDKTAYVTGLTLPAKSKVAAKLSPEKLPDVVLRDGQLVHGLSVVDAVKEMQAGDVFIKGANALDYKGRVGGILIGHPTGGTIGATIGTIIARRINLVIPVGLEKLVYGDIAELSRLVTEDKPVVGEMPSLWTITGIIITEIEALKVLTGVDAHLMASGGVGGAEGSIRLLVEGTDGQIQKTMQLVDSIQGERSFC